LSCLVELLQTVALMILALISLIERFG